MVDENLLNMAEQKFKGAAEKIAKDLIATCHKKQQTNADRIREMEAENKQLHLQLETITKDRDYYRDAYHHLLKERENRDTLPRADIINT